MIGFKRENGTKKKAVQSTVGIFVDGRINPEC
jgi:hypothetical protein